MKNWQLLALAPAVAAAILAAAGSARPSAAPSIEGTYVLEYRELPDGKRLQAPDIGGLFTATKTHRNFNVFWKEKGKTTSISIMSKYTLTEKEFTEENVFFCTGDEGSGKAPTYDTSSTKGSSPVTIKGDRIEWKMPLHDEPSVVFDKTSLTATRKDAFVDHWKKVN